jgi:hypothetical protein
LYAATATLRGLPWLWPKLKAESANEFWVLRGHVCFSYAPRVSIAELPAGPRVRIKVRYDSG